MIQLENLECTRHPDGKTWDLTSAFSQIGASIILHETIDSGSSTNQSFKYGAGVGGDFRSRSYSGSFFIEVISGSRCGIDLEIPSDSAIDWSIDSPAFEKAILSRGEKDLILATEYRDMPNLATVIWASKEALAKALGDASKYEPSDLVSPICWTEGKQGKWQATHLDFVTQSLERLIVWLVTEVPTSSSE